MDPERFPDGGYEAVQDVDRGTPEAECQWWADWLGDEQEYGKHHDSAIS
jgi:hypothetical protein